MSESEAKSDQRPTANALMPRAARRVARVQSPKKPNARLVAVSNNDAGGVRYSLLPEGYRVVAEMIAGGHSEASVAATLGMHATTLSNMKKQDEALREAMARGRGILEDEVVTSIVQHMREGSVAAAIFLAKGKVGLREVGPSDPNAPTTAIQVNISVPPALDASQVATLLGHAIPEPGDE